MLVAVKLIVPPTHTGVLLPAVGADRLRLCATLPAWTQGSGDVVRALRWTSPNFRSPWRLLVERPAGVLRPGSCPPLPWYFARRIPGGVPH